MLVSKQPSMVIMAYACNLNDRQPTLGQCWRPELHHYRAAPHHEPIRQRRRWGSDLQGNNSMAAL